MKKLISLSLMVTIHFSIGAQSYLWFKTFGGINYDHASSVVTDSQGNLYTLGNFQGTVDFDPGPATFNLSSSGGYDVFIVKLDGDGNFKWAKAMGASNGDDRGSSITTDAAGNVYATGSYDVGGDFDPGPGIYNLSGLKQFFVMKLDPSGNFLWAKGAGGQYFNYSYSITVDNSGNVYTTGHFESGGDFDPGPGTFYLYSPGGYNIFILKLDGNGNFTWAKSLGGSSNAEGRAIAVDAAGNVYTSGHFSYTVDFDPGPGTSVLTSAGESDVYLLKLNGTGDFLWAKQLGGPGSDAATSLTLDESGNIFSYGQFSGIADFNPGPEKYELTTHGYYDIFIMKLNSAGDFQWARNVGGSDNDLAMTLAVDGSGSVFASGAFRAVADFDPGSPVHNLTAVGDYDAFIVRLDDSGNFLWSTQVGGYATENIVITLDASGTLYGAAQFWDNLSLGGEPPVVLSSNGADDILLLKLSTITGLEGSVLTSNIEVFPNPAKDRIIANDESMTAGTPFSIFDVLGHYVLKGTLNSEKQIDINSLPSGVYTLKLYNNRRIWCAKIIKVEP
jgi:hypothetical protein